MSDIKTLQEEWHSFKYYQNIDSNEIDSVWDCFNHYKDKIENGQLKLSEYTNTISNTDDTCTYLCQFFENGSAKYFARAKPGNAENYAIKRNTDNSYYCSSKITSGIEIRDASYEIAEQYFPKILENLQYSIKEYKDSTKDEILEYIENNRVIPGKLILKIIAMSNNGEFLYTYKSDVLENIYKYFFSDFNKNLTDIELSYAITKKLKNIFVNIDDNIDVYLIKLSSFLWGKFKKPLSESYMEDNNGEKNMTDKCNHDTLNQILYGPPGTGKTYKTIDKALKIIFSADGMDQSRKYDIVRIDKNNSNSLSYADAIKNDDREALKSIYNYFSKREQIEFVTFHQSYGYEEFVEGIKAIPPGEKGNPNPNMIYAIQKGVFAQLAKKAKENYSNSKKEDIVLREEISLKQQVEGFLSDSNVNGIEFYKTQKGVFTIQSLEEDKIVVYVRDTNNSEYILDLDMDEFIKVINANKAYKTSKEMAHEVFGLEKQRRQHTYYLSMYREYKKYIPSKNIKNIQIDKSLKNYILIIDEINRGNISKIFGELITLIEPSKRLGGDEALMVKLPYSKDDFDVPSNLYIIGTMNTADRSIAQIDTALRRRFVFEEMMPKPELLSKLVIVDSSDNNININVEEMLSAINERIEYIYDREHTIGHSYFMELLKKGCNTKDKLDEIFRVNIIPLLAEYFYGDWNDIKVVLNDTKDEGEFIIKKSESKYAIKDNRQNNKIFTVKVSDEGNVDFSVDGYRNIYTFITK